MTIKTTSASELRQKIEEKRYSYFSFPILDITIKYRKPDLLKLSFDNSLPSALAGIVIEGYKEVVNSGDAEAFKQKIQSQGTNLGEDFLKELSQKGYLLLKQLSVSHQFLDVPESDFDAEPKPLIAFADVPEEDAMSFVTHLINTARITTTDNGGEISMDDIENFPTGTQSTKRDTNGARRKAVRKSA